MTKLTIKQVLDQYFCQTADGELFATRKTTKKEFKQFMSEGHTRIYENLPPQIKSRILENYRKHQLLCTR